MKPEGSRDLDESARTINTTALSRGRTAETSPFRMPSRASSAGYSESRRLHHLGIVRHAADGKTQVPDERQHRLVVGQDLALDLLQTLRSVPNRSAGASNATPGRGLSCPPARSPRTHPIGHRTSQASRATPTVSPVASRTAMNAISRS